MTTTAESDYRPLCPNCQALVPPRSVVCASCGVNLDQFRAALPGMRRAQDERVEIQERDLHVEHAQRVAEENFRTREQSRQGLRMLLIVAALLTVIVAALSAWVVLAQRQHEARLQAEYEAAASCLSAEDYLCARDRFQALIAEEEAFRDAREQLALARYGLAAQYADAGLWSNAIDELDALLETRPGDVAALALMEDVYNRWIIDSVGHGDLLSALRLQLQRASRFSQ